MYGQLEALKIPSVLTGLLFRELTAIDSLMKLAEDLATDIYVPSDRPTAAQMLAAARMFLASVNA